MSVLNSAQQNAVAELLRVSPVADELGRRFGAAGHELHLVGGSVRDALLGRLGDDLDFSTDAQPEQTLALVQGWAEAIWETGASSARSALQRPASGWRSPRSGPRPTTGLRRNPVGLVRHSLLDDLVRRDFTINAMAVSVPRHEFTDPYGGLRDLAGQVIRTPAAPRTVVRRRSTSDAAGGPVRRQAAASRWTRRSWRRCATWPPTSTGSPPSGSATSSPSCCAAPIRSPGCGCWSTPAWPTGSCRSCPA